MENRIDFEKEKEGFKQLQENYKEDLKDALSLKKDIEKKLNDLKLNWRHEDLKEELININEQIELLNIKIGRIDN